MRTTPSEPDQWLTLMNKLGKLTRAELELLVIDFASISPAGAADDPHTLEHIVLDQLAETREAYSLKGRDLSAVKARR